MENKVYIDPYPKTMKMLGLERINIDCGNNTSIVTPANIAKDMVALLPDDVFIPESKFLDICCKSGIFLTSIREKLMNSKAMIEAIPDDKERYRYITDNQLYGIAPNGQCQMYSVRAVYGTLRVDNPHILCFGVFDQYKTACLNNNHKMLIDEMKKEFGQMKFDVVIGNPPYNRGLDVDFVFLGYTLCDKYTCMITPAKWQTAEASQGISSQHSYGEFRQVIVPCIKQVCFYPCCKDVFDIYQTDGISYFLVDKNKKYDIALVSNKCNDITVFNGEEYRSILHEESLLNIGQEIIDSLGTYKVFQFPYITGNKRYEIWMNTKVSGYDWYATKHPRYVLSISRLIDNTKNESYSGEAKCIFESDSIEECKSFISWIYSRFTRFFLVPNISKLNNIQTDHCFRFVPAPPSGKFDHIYTDEELYKAFNLPQKYIGVIEAVIKERK